MCHISGLGVSATCLAASPALARTALKLGGACAGYASQAAGPESMKLGMTGGSLKFLLVGPSCFYAGSEMHTVPWTKGCGWTARRVQYAPAWVNARWKWVRGE